MRRHRGTHLLGRVRRQRRVDDQHPAGAPPAPRRTDLGGGGGERVGPGQGACDGEGRPGDGGARRRTARRGSGVRRFPRCDPNAGAERGQRRHPRLDRRTAGGGGGLPGRRLRPHQAEDRARLGSRAGGRGAAADRSGCPVAGRRQHRVPARGHRPPLPPRRVRPPVDRAAAARGRSRRPRPPRSGRVHSRVPRRVDHVGDGREGRDRDRGLRDRQPQAGTGRRLPRGPADPRPVRRARGAGLVRRDARDGHRPGRQRRAGRARRVHAHR